MQGQKQETTQNQMEWDQKSYGMLTSEKASVQQVANKGVNLKHNWLYLNLIHDCRSTIDVTYLAHFTTVNRQHYKTTITNVINIRLKSFITILSLTYRNIAIHRNLSILLILNFAQLKSWTNFCLFLWFILNEWSTESLRFDVRLFEGGQHQEPKMTGMSGTITKLTLASYCVTPSKKTPMSCQTTSDDVKAM